MANDPCIICGSFDGEIRVSGADAVHSVNVCSYGHLEQYAAQKQEE